MATNFDVWKPCWAKAKYESKGVSTDVEYTRFCGLDTKTATDTAYNLANRIPIIPQPDEMTLPTLLAEELYELGKKAAPIPPLYASLPVFNVTMFIDPDCDETNIDKLLQPSRPYREDLWIHGFDALFVACAPSEHPRAVKNGVSCLLSLYDCNDSSGGLNEVALFSFFERGTPTFEIIPWNVSKEAELLCDLTGLETLAHWLAFLWRGIQSRLENRPELIRQRHVRATKEGIAFAKSNASGKTRIVKTYKVITIESDLKALPAAQAPSHKKISCPAWGVMGHWRQCKSGKRTWIKPYFKGLERNSPRRYSSKEYVLPKEVTQYANP